MNVRLLVVPYDSGLRNARMGAGPERLVQLEWPDRLRRLGHDVDVRTIEADAEPPAEIAVAFELAGRVADEVGAARREGRFPVVLSGNCAAAVGVVAGLARPAADTPGEARSGVTAEPRRVRVLWLDSHADLHTPETTRSGFLDGMTLAVVLGRCWAGMAGGIAGFKPLPDSSITMVGVRDLDPDEQSWLRRSDVALLAPERARAIIPAGALPGDHLAGTTGYVHLDVDVFDPDSVGVANRYAAPEGLSLAEVQAVVRADAARGAPAALTVSAYDPECDEGDAVADAALAVLETVLALATGSASSSP